MTDWEERVCAHISEATGVRFVAERRQTTGGGCINQAVILVSEKRRYFVKINQAPLVDMFAAEAEGLTEICRSGTVRVPEPICWGTAARSAYLVLQHVALGRARGAEAERQLGRQLAMMHKTTRGVFGWRRDNTIGSTPQINTENSDWLAFWRQHRLGFQLELAGRKGHLGRLQSIGDKLLISLDAFFTGHRPTPSLLHGDLWGGNWSVDAAGDPVVFDPAVYYGDRETDLAMTELFGGFGSDFYAAYREQWPLDAGYRARLDLYNLYHILNHLNLFGGGYRAQAESMIEGLLAKC